jgi:histone demethylase JARID1
MFPLLSRGRVFLVLQHFKFSTRKQKVNELEGESRVNMNFVDGLVKFHAQHGWEITKMPVLGRIPVDLFLLKKLIDKRGGHEKVT